MSGVEEAVAALRAGRAVVLPFDTVYGLAADPSTPEPTRRLYELKGRAATQPSALVAADVERLVERIPELPGDAATHLEQLLPGPYTLILPNPARRFPWLAGTNPDAVGVRVPELRGPTAEVLRRLGAVVATSANRPGEPDPATLADVPAELRAGAGAVVDGGRLPGRASTVVDLTGPEPRIVREGVVAGDEVLRRLGSAVRSS
jgi:L-threonylcarbamoyladenylate synthase